MCGESATSGLPITRGWVSSLEEAWVTPLWGSDLSFQRRVNPRRGKGKKAYIWPHFMCIVNAAVNAIQNDLQVFTLGQVSESEERDDCRGMQQQSC